MGIIYEFCFSVDIAFGFSNPLPQILGCSVKTTKMFWDLTCPVS